MADHVERARDDPPSVAARQGGGGAKRLLEAATRRLYRWLIPSGAKNTLRLRLLLDERDKPPEVIEEFAARSVLVLAPHPDDEVIGCGGTLRRHLLAGAHVTVVFLTDGRRGDRELDENSGFVDKELTRARDELSVRRKRESEKAAEILGIQELVFLDGPDGALDDTPALTNKLREVLRRCNPSLIYVPSMLDLHADHWATNRLFYRCLDALDKTAPLLREYEVWTPLLINRLVVVDDVMQEKRRALEQFASQNPARLVNATVGLNRYRSIYLYQAKERQYAEAFYESSPEQYRLLFEKFAGKR